MSATGTRWLSMDEMALAADVDILLVGTAGAAGLTPTLRALRAGRPVAIANKEVLVMAGHLVRRAMLAGGGSLRPVDSEHSAIWQCLQVMFRLGSLMSQVLQWTQFCALITNLGAPASSTHS